MTMHQNHNFDHEPSRNNEPRASDPAGTTDPFKAAIIGWLQRSRIGNTLQEQANLILSGYTSASKIDLIKTQATPLPTMQSPASLKETLLNAAGYQSKRQQLISQQIQASKDLLTHAQANNQDLLIKIRLLITQTIETQFDKSPQLVELLTQINSQRSLYERRREFWDELDREATRMAGGASTLINSQEFRTLAEFTQTQITEFLVRGREEYRKMCIEQVSSVTDWDLTPAKISALWRQSKDGGLTIPIEFDPKDTVRAVRSVARVGAYFISESTQHDEESVEAQINEDMVLGALNDMKAQLVLTQQQLTSTINICELVLGCLLQSLGKH